MELPAQNKYEKLEIPQSDEIFYFDHDVYDESILGPFIPKENFNYILTECEKIVCKSHVKKEKFDKQELKTWIYVFGGIILIIFLIFLIILYYSPRYKEGKNLYLISIGFALFGIFIIVILLFYNIFKSKNVGKEIDDFVSEDLIKYLSTIQKELSNEIIFSYDKKKKMIIMNYPLENKKETLRRLRLEKRNEVALNSEHNLLPSKDLKNLSNLELFSNNNYNGTDFSKLQKNGKRKGE
jgi:hypothetical protein